MSAGNPLFNLKKDSSLEIDGAWFDFMPTIDKDGKDAFVRFKLRRNGGANTQFLKEIEKTSKPYRHSGNKMDAPTQLKIVEKVFCNHILVDWENVQNAEGDFIEFSTENAQWLFDELPDVYQALLLEVNSGAMFSLEQCEADAKN